MDIIQAVAQVDKLPIVIFNAQTHTAITVIDSNVLPVLLETEGAIIISYHSPDVFLGVPAEGSIATHSHICTHIIVSCLFTGQRLMVGRRIDHHLIAVGNGGVGLGLFLLTEDQQVAYVCIHIARG